MLSLLTIGARCVGSGAHVSLPSQGHATFRIASKHTLIRSHILPKQWQLHLELQRKEWQLQQQELQAQLQQKELQSQLQQKELQSKLQQKELQSQLQLQQKELQSQLQLQQKELQSQLQQKELQLRDMQLQIVTRNLLFEKGKLSMRGLIEYAEEHLLPVGSAARGKGRQAVWAAIVDNNEQLRDCLRKRGIPLASVPKRVEALYSHLSGHIHSYKYQHSSTAIDIVEGPASREQVALLECTARAASAPYKLSSSELWSPAAPQPSSSSGVGIVGGPVSPAAPQAYSSPESRSVEAPGSGEE